MKVKIPNRELRELLNVESPEFPKYVSQLINLAGQNSQATRPRVVGQMSELIQEFPGKTLPEWEKWYVEQHPEAISRATEKIVEMLQNFRDALNQVDREMVEKWVKDLVIVKTFVGLRFQEAVLKKLANVLGVSYRLATPEEEARGIDGFLGEQAISIKPASYRSKQALREEIDVQIAYYEKQKNDLIVEWTNSP